MRHDREYEIVLAANRASLRVGYSGRPIDDYSVVLVANVEGEWHEIRVHDNHLGTHHMPGTLDREASKRQKRSIPGRRAKRCRPRSNT